MSHATNTTQSVKPGQGVDRYNRSAVVLSGHANMAHIRYLHKEHEVRIL